MGQTLRCIFHQASRDCLDEAKSDLMVHESENSLLLGLLNGLVDGRFVPNALLYMSVTDGVNYRGHALRTDLNTPLDLSPMSTKAVDCIADALHRRAETVAKVVGPREACHHFAARWTQLSGLGISKTMEQGIYELRHVQMPHLDGGQLRLATESDDETLISFLRRFFEETGAPETVASDRAKHILTRDRPKQNVFVWEDRWNRPVSMAARVRDTDNGASISYVYTPPLYRRQGHGGRVVACLSKRLLDGGKRMCNLYTDLANPTSNGIYQKVGYSLIARSAEITFDAGV